MFKYFFDTLFENRTLKFISGFFVAMTVWWISIYIRGLVERPENLYFVLIYPLITFVAGVAGMMFAKKWGGFKSVLGRAIAFLALGMLAQFIGQILYNYYTFILGIEVPYPSLGDYVFLSSILFYIIGAYQLSKVSGLKLSVQGVKGKLKAILIPGVILLGSYFLLLQEYDFTQSTSESIFFDFGFPIGQAIYVSIALLALFISKDILGGMMRRPIMLLIGALIFQYIADFIFSYQYSLGTIYYGGFMDYLYFLAYYLMTIAIFAIGNMFYKVKDS